MITLQKISSRGGLVVEPWSENRLDSITVDRIPLVDVYMVKIPESKRNYGPAVDIFGMLHVYIDRVPYFH